MEKQIMKPIILVDGSSYLFRAYHALPPLTNSQGEPTGAMYGAVNMLHRLLREYQPENIAVVFDPKGKNFRHQLYEPYKANRAIMPDDLRVQIQPLFQIIKAMGLPLIIVDGVEADDVIGTYTAQATKAKHDVLIATNDKDMAQLVNGHITLLNTMTNQTMDSQGVYEKFGVQPDQIIDYLALIGDTVDNVPGVAGVGPKTAVKWLQAYGSLAGIIAHADQISGKVGENLRAHLADLPLYQTLVTIKCDVELPNQYDDLALKPRDIETLKKLYHHYGFKNWLNELEKESPSSAAEGTQVVKSTTPTEKKYHTLLTETDFEAYYKKLEQAESFVIDTETTSLDPFKSRIVGLSFAIDASEAVYIPLAHDYLGAPKQLNKKNVLERLKPLLEDENKQKIGQNLKYDRGVFLNEGITLRGIAYDTMLESYVVNSIASKHDMDSLALNYLQRQTIKFEDIAGKGAHQLTFNQIELEKASPYAAEDADVTFELHETLWPQLCAHPTLKDVFLTIEMPLVPVLSTIERHGVLIDTTLLREQSLEFERDIEKIETETYQLADCVFNLSSPKQLQEILFEKMGLPVIEKTPTGQPSTAESVLSDLAHDFPLPALILKHRTLTKLKSTYIDKLPTQIHPQTGRIHTSYHQAITATGRLSSSDPNLQNIPVRHEEGRRIRRAFIAPAGYKLIACDYSQIELRILAHLCGEESLINAFAAGLDIHSATAAEVFNTPLESVTLEQRRHAKAINFGLIYGMSAFGLAKQIGVDRREAQAYVDLYFKRYPTVKIYMEETRRKAREQGYVETLYGRRLYLPEINSKNKMRQLAAERTAINAPMQGTAADLIKLAMIKTQHWLETSKVDAKMIMQVHDELVFEVADADVDTVAKEVRRCMTAFNDLRVPLVVEIGIGQNWDAAH